MNSIMTTWTLVAGLLVAAPFTASAEPNKSDSEHAKGVVAETVRITQQRFEASSVPELDPSSAGAALALAAGGFLVLRSRRRPVL